MIFFFIDTATTEIYTLSLHDALPILPLESRHRRLRLAGVACFEQQRQRPPYRSQTCTARSEEHTSELQSHVNLVCRLLLEKKKTRHDPCHSSPFLCGNCRISPLCRPF